MEVYVYRHALADFEKDHENPPLSDAGRKQVSTITRLARGFGFEPNQIVSSPLVRAKETAEITKKTLGLNSSVIVNECLYGGKKLSAVYTMLNKFKPTDKIVLVSHQPLIDNLISDLIRGEKANFEMLNGAIAAIEVKSKKVGKNTGTLIWLASPARGK